MCFYVHVCEWGLCLCVCGRLWIFSDVQEITVDSGIGKVVTRDSEGPPALVIKESL